MNCTLMLSTNGDEIVNWRRITSLCELILEVEWPYPRMLLRIEILEKSQLH